MNIGMVARRTGLVAVLGGAALVGSVNLEREASAGGGGGCHGSPEREGSGTLVALAGNCFSPIVLNVETGATVTFENMDPVTHDIGGVAGSWGTGGTLLAQGGTASMTFTEPGLYPYSCYLHYGMTGVISVGDERSVAGWAPGAMTVSRVPAAPDDSKTASVSAADDGGFDSGWLMAGGGALVGVVVVSGAWVVRSRR